MLVDRSLRPLDVFAADSDSVELNFRSQLCPETGA